MDVGTLSEKPVTDTRRGGMKAPPSASRRQVTRHTLTCSLGAGEAAFVAFRSRFVRVSAQGASVWPLS